MGWAQRANRVAQDKRAGLLTPKPSAPSQPIRSRAELVDEMFRFFGVSLYALSVGKRRRGRPSSVPAVESSAADSGTPTPREAA